jgi:hypothetical protein
LTQNYQSENDNWGTEILRSLGGYPSFFHFGGQFAAGVLFHSSLYPMHILHSTLFFQSPTRRVSIDMPILYIAT